MDGNSPKEFEEPAFKVDVREGDAPGKIDVDITLYDHFGIPPEMFNGKDESGLSVLLALNRMRLRGLASGCELARLVTFGGKD